MFDITRFVTKKRGRNYSRCYIFFLVLRSINRPIARLRVLKESKNINHELKTRVYTYLIQADINRVKFVQTRNEHIRKKVLVFQLLRILVNVPTLLPQAQRGNDVPV